MPGDFSFSSDVAPVCEVGMSDVAQAEPDSWLDVSCFVHEAELQRGRDRFNDRFQPGTATITFKNNDGWADLVGDYAAVELTKLRPGRPIRVGVIGPFDGGPIVTRWLWRGYIDQARPSYDPVESDTVTVSCIDALGEAGMRELLGGPLVGVNEAVHTRINRVLNARQWWASKRSIEVGTALMQGETMSGSTSDLLTTPADSAGGVIFGDVDGNVVYRDMDWELYDPDTPHDGEIGNCDPGQAPSAGTPPYIDPTKGTVYNETPDPPTHPHITHFCAGPGSAGTILERGEAYTVFIAGIPPHLYLTENGHTWDLGVWNDIEGGCVTIEHPTPPPTGTPPNTPPTPPNIPPNPPTPPGTPPEEPGVPPTPPDQPPQEVPPTGGGDGGGGGGGGGGGPEEVTFGVELLGFSDGGLTDPAFGTVIVTGITPGPGRLLIVLVCALCDNVTGSLTPFPIAGGSITGGGVTFDEIGREPAGGDGAESYAAAGRTGRTDPGTFDVTVDWASDHASREHIVTVWGVHRERADMLDRLKLGSYLRSLTWDRIGGVAPSPNPPGKGFWQTAFENPATDTPPYPHLSDITIGQSLAESPNPPYGATFNVADGEWWTPTFAASPALRAVPGPVFRDDFDRADGPLGPGWQDPPVIPWDAEATTVAIVSQAVEGGVDAVINDIRTMGFAQTVATIEAGAPQYVEIALTNVFQGSPAAVLGGGTGADITSTFELYTLADNVEWATMECSFGWTGSEGEPGRGSLSVHVRHDPGDFDYGPGFANVVFPDHDPARVIVLRLESSPQGAQRCFVDGVLVLESSLPSMDGQHVGFGLYWVRTLEDHVGPGTSPRIEWVEMGVAPDMGIVRKCSWVAGYRGPLTPPQLSPPDVKFDTVNTGPDDLQSCQACVVIEPLLPDQFGWRTLAYYADAPEPPATIPPTSHGSTVRYERASIVLVYVAAFAATDIAAGITVSSSAGLTFAVARSQGAVAPSHAQGVVFWAKTPDLALAPDATDVITVAWGAALEGVSYLIEEVTNGGAVAATGSAVRGTHVLGSVDGGVSVVLSAAPATSSVVLGFLGVAGEPNESGVDGGADFVEEIEYLPSGKWAYLQGQSRVASASNLVNWTDMNASSPTGPQASDAVALAVEVTPGPSYVNWETTGPLTIGGSLDAYNGPIYNVDERDADGNIIWSFGAGDPH